MQEIKEYYEKALSIFKNTLDRLDTESEEYQQSRNYLEVRIQELEKRLEVIGGKK